MGSGQSELAAKGKTINAGNEYSHTTSPANQLTANGISLPRLNYYYYQ
jgi:hypothetical protein